MALRLFNIKFIFTIVAFTSVFTLNSQMFTTLESDIDFISNAPLEVISAKSNEMQGLLDVESKRFAFKIYIKSFDGFNSNLQKIHFYENYMETNDFPTSAFSGKIVEDLKEGSGKYRAKGILEIHGVKREVIIPVDLSFSNEIISINSNFKVRLDDYNITIPKLVYQKIAEEIDISVAGILKKRE